jgi:hypothetical protein
MHKSLEQIEESHAVPRAMRLISFAIGGRGFIISQHPITTPKAGFAAQIFAEPPCIGGIALDYEGR